MRVLHLIQSHTPTYTEKQDVFIIRKGFSDYRRFWNVLKETDPEVIHMHMTEGETFGVYAAIATIQRIKVIRTLQSPIVYKYWYVIKQLVARFFYAHTICTSRYDLEHVDQYHLAAKSKRSLIYRGVDSKKPEEVLKKDAARNFIYKKLGIAFAKSIRMIGAVIQKEEGAGVEHMIDAAYLADKYKNLTNTVFVLLYKGKADAAFLNQIEEQNVGGIFFIIEDVESPEEYIPAFDIYMSTRTSSGDLYLLFQAMYMHIPAIATRVGDTYEFDPYVAAPLVPMHSAKFLTEALMYVIRNDTPNMRLKNKNAPISKRLTEEHERAAIHDLYLRVARKTKHIPIA